VREAEKKTNPARWLEGIIKDFINRSPENTLKNPTDEKAWDDPLVGFSSGEDPLYQQYKEKYIGPFHWTPAEVFQMAFPESKAEAAELTVISWILPQMEKTKSDLRKEKLYPSESWARARIFGEEANVKLRKHVVDTLMASGIEAVSPMIFPLWEMSLFYSYGTCGKCMARCPADAVTKNGHDKQKCIAYVNMTRTYVTSNFGFEGYGCGFCQTGVPCESRIPAPEEGE